jgi:UDP-N-acetylmuramoyl-tripeptide--D-alanyl-D-alanine ligase
MSLRIYNTIIASRRGSVPLQYGQRVTLRELACIRVEFGFAFHDHHVTFRWIDAEGSIVAEDFVTVSRSTIVHFARIPAPVDTDSLRLFIQDDGLTLFYCEFLAHVGSHSSLEAVVLQADLVRSFMARRAWVQSLPIRRMFELAGEAIQRRGARVIVVTGSVGKTTTKELIYHLVRDDVFCCTTTDSWNFPHEICSQIILNEDWADLFVIEAALGAYMPLMGEFIVPNVFIFTHLGQAHTRFAGSIKELGKAKASLAKSMTPDGLILYLYDVDAIRRSLHEQLSMGIKRPRLISVSGKLRTSADITVRQVRGGNTIKISGCGIESECQIEIATVVPPTVVAFGLLAVRELGISQNHLAERSSTFSGVPGRMHHEKIGRLLLIDDSYNANPVSVENLLLVLRNYRNRGHRVAAVLGPMLDLGGISNQAHLDIVKLVRSCLDFTVFVGKEFAQPLSDVITRTVRYYDNVSALLDEQDALCVLADYDIVAFKGSSGTGIDRLASNFRGLLKQSVDRF